ncbi:hypothetical protein ACFFRR_008279 [Megaselia abdita]
MGMLPPLVESNSLPSSPQPEQFREIATPTTDLQNLQYSPVSESSALEEDAVDITDKSLPLADNSLEPDEAFIAFKKCAIKIARCCVCETVNNLRPVKPTIIPVLKRQNEFHWQENRQNYICLECLVTMNLQEDQRLLSFLKPHKSSNDLHEPSEKTENSTDLKSNQLRPPTIPKKTIEDKIVDDFVWIKKFSCPIFDCDYSADGINAASLHCDTEHKLFPWYFCHKCNQRFMCKDYLNMHLRAQCFFDTSQSVCYKCGKEFLSIYSLNEHFENHRRYRNYHCKLCHFSFLEKKLQLTHYNSDNHEKKTLKPSNQIKMTYFTEKSPRRNGKYKVHIKVLRNIEKPETRYPDKYWDFGWNLGKVQRKNCKKVFPKTIFLEDFIS